MGGARENGGKPELSGGWNRLKRVTIVQNCFILRKGREPEEKGMDV